MKIAVLSPPWIAVPPVGYGGTELVVANLVEGLVKRGHEVMLFATGDSKTSARLEYFYEKAIGNDLSLKLNPFYLLNHFHKFFKIVKQEKFDIIHNHTAYQGMFFCDLQDTPFVHTLHGGYYKDLKAPSGFVEDKRQVLWQFRHHPFISISNNQRQGMPELNYIATVYNGIKPEEFKLGNGEGGYLAWLGRITPNKGLDIAIRVAQKLKIPLKIAAFVDPGADGKYFEEQIKPLISQTKEVEFLGEICDPEKKTDFLGKAIATLFPIRWHEPFGLVMVESMASGTPVIAFNKGSVPEVIENEKTGFIVENENEMIEAVKKINRIDRKYCHQYAISRFSVEKMVENYEKAYQKVISFWPLKK